MKKAVTIFGMTALIIIGITANLYAYSFGHEDFNGIYQYGNQNQGQYIGTVYGGNDNVDTLIDFLTQLSGLNRYNPQAVL